MTSKQEPSVPAPPERTRRRWNRPALFAAAATVPATALIVWWLAGRENAVEIADRALTEARRAMQVGDLATAESRLRTAIEKVPESGVLQHNLGVLHLRQNRTAEARAAFELAARAHGSEARKLRAQEYFELASISVGEASWKRAELELQEAIAADSSNGLFHARLLDLQLRHLKNATAAESTAARYLRALGDTAANLHDIGYVYFQQEEYGRAETWARKAVARDSTMTQAHALVAESLARQGRGAEAVNYLEPLLRRDPRNGELWIARAHVAMALKVRRDVLRAAERAVEASPNSFEAHLLRMRALASLGRLDEAMAVVVRARAAAADPMEHRRLRTEELNLQRALRIQRQFMVGRAGVDSGARP